MENKVASNFKKPHQCYQRLNRVPIKSHSKPNIVDMLRKHTCYDEDDDNETEGLFDLNLIKDHVRFPLVVEA